MEHNVSLEKVVSMEVRGLYWQILLKDFQPIMSLARLAQPKP